jgi:hypothetical protein
MLKLHIRFQYMVSIFYFIYHINLHFTIKRNREDLCPDYFLFSLF